MSRIFLDYSVNFKSIFVIENLKENPSFLIAYNSRFNNQIFSSKKLAKESGADQKIYMIDARYFIIIIIKFQLIIIILHHAYTLLYTATQNKLMIN